MVESAAGERIGYLAHSGGWFPTLNVEAYEVQPGISWLAVTPSRCESFFSMTAKVTQGRAMSALTLTDSRPDRDGHATRCGDAFPDDHGDDERIDACLRQDLAAAPVSVTCASLAAM